MKVLLKKILVVMSIPFLLMEMMVRDFNTFIHSWKTAKEAYVLTTTLKQMPWCLLVKFEKSAFYMFFVGLCHDFGKIDLLRTKEGSRILKSKDKLSDEEFAVVKTHQNSKTAKWAAILFPEVEFHHEKSNGSGYLGVVNLTPEMETVAVADVSSALEMKRNYKCAMEKKEVKEIMEKMPLNQNIVRVY